MKDGRITLNRAVKCYKPCRLKEDDERYKDSMEFFTAEKGLVYFYENKCEYLTNEQRRFFEYDKIGNIKIIKHLYIFVMKRSKDKSMKGFAYMVIPRRNMNDHQQKQLDEICASIIKKYDLKEWVTSQIFG